MPSDFTCSITGVRPLGYFFIEIPVAERRPVAAAPFKPAVVNDKSLDAQRAAASSAMRMMLPVIMVEVNPFQVLRCTGRGLLS